MSALLQLSGLHAYYGKSHILHGVDMRVGEGEIVSLLGRNGSGRSTTVKTIMGLVRGEGSIRLRGDEILGQRTFDIAHRGIGYVPENRDIFPKLTVHQNLQLGEKRAKKAPRWSYDDMYRMFPRLQERADTEAGQTRTSSHRAFRAGIRCRPAQILRPSQGYRQQGRSRRPIRR